MTFLDHLVVLLYIFALVVITYYSVKAVKKPSNGAPEFKFAERQFLAGRQASIFEAVFSIVATEFSAVTFIQLPALAILGKRGLLWGLFGIMIGRWVISKFLIRNFYRSGITVFDSLSRGVKNYSTTTSTAQKGKQLLGLIYFFSKILSVAAGIYLGANFVSKFYGLNYQWVLFGIVMITSTYTIVGGLKAIMRTDILQFSTIVVGGLVLMFSGLFNSKELGFTEILNVANTVSFGTSGLLPILLGIVSGFISDFTTHGIEQDFVQKLKACRTPSIAARAVVWSTWLTIGLQILFIFIGAVFLNRLPEIDASITEAMDLFMDLTVSNLGPGAKGLVVVSLLSATMSSLDSSLNALSSVLWSDILPAENLSRFPILIKIDNAVVAVFVALFAFFVGQNPMYIKGFINLNTYFLLPLVCCFILRFVCYPKIMFSFGLHTVVFTILSCILGLVLNTFYFELPPQMAIFLCLALSMLCIKFYEKLEKVI